MDSTKIQRYQNKIIDFWREHGRHGLAWRQTTDPWKLLLAEMLLRKTTSAQAEQVYRQLEPLSCLEIAKMNAEQLEEVLHPLGISRVRTEQIREAASVIAVLNPEDMHSDSFLRSLQGIGHYISNSVRCCAFGIPAPALDTNMIRVIERVFGWVSKRARAREDKKLWDFAQTLVPADQCREYNWGVLDFASAICTHRNPHCDICPIQDICDYYNSLMNPNDR